MKKLVVHIEKYGIVGYVHSFIAKQISQRQTRNHKGKGKLLDQIKSVSVPYIDSHTTLQSAGLCIHCSDPISYNREV